MPENPEVNLSASDTPVERMEKFSPRQFLQLIGTVSSSTDLDTALRNLCDSLTIIYSDSQVSIYSEASDHLVRFFFTSGKVIYRPGDHAVVPGEGILGESLKSSHSILIDDFSKYKEHPQPHPRVNCALIVPILFQSRLIAFIEILGEKAREYSLSDQTTMEALAASLAVIFHNLQISNTLRLKADRGELMNDIVTDFSAENSLQNLLLKAAQELGKIPEVSEISIYLSHTDENK